MIQAAILGHGVVGSGVYEILDTNREYIAKNIGQEMQVKRILDLRDFDLPYADLFTKDANDILNDDEISVVAEVMGGVHPAYEFTKEALCRGKNVVTSNKELVAEKGAELLQIAKEHNVNYYFEASVGGGIPIIRPMHSCLAANRIEAVAGILNGTTNFILTKMIDDNMGFEEALKLAQELGYAEKDPTADVDGHDACRKICILASLAYGKRIRPESVYTEGIRKVTLEDVAYAESCQSVIKLIGRVTPVGEDGMVSCMVTPALVNQESRLATIKDVFNGILVRGNMLGEVAFYGRGAGKLPTASAVVADMIDVAKRDKTVESLNWVDDGKDYVLDYKESDSGYYLRVLSEKDCRGLVEAQFGAVTYLSREGQPENETAFLVESVNEQKLLEIEEELSQNGVTVLGKIRVLNY